MEEQQIQDLLRVLFNLKYDWVSGQEIHKSDVIREENRQIVETAIRAFMLDNRDAKIGTPKSVRGSGSNCCLAFLF